MISAQMEITPDVYSIQQEKKMDFKLKIVFTKDDVKQLYQKSESVIELGILTVQFMAEPTLYRLKRYYFSKNRYRLSDKPGSTQDRNSLYILNLKIFLDYTTDFQN